MAYASIVEMTESESLIMRVAGCAAQEGFDEEPADLWARRNIWTIVSKDTGWVTAWDYARDTATADDNPDTGARPGVINDDMILAVVQPMINPPPPPAPEEPPPVVDNTLPPEETPA